LFGLAGLNWHSSWTNSFLSVGLYTGHFFNGDAVHPVAYRRVKDTLKTWLESAPEKHPAASRIRI